MSTKNPSDYDIGTGSFEWKPTGSIQAIAEKPFTVNHIEKFTSKAGETLVIVETDETFDGIEYKNQDGDKTTGKVNRFFASPVDIKKFFSNEEVIQDVNENGNKIRAAIEKVPFTAEEISRDGTLKGKTHYVFKKGETKQEALA